MIANNSYEVMLCISSVTYSKNVIFISRFVTTLQLISMDESVSVTY